MRRNLNLSFHNLPKARMMDTRTDKEMLYFGNEYCLVKKKNEKKCITRNLKLSA